MNDRFSRHVGDVLPREEGPQDGHESALIGHVGAVQDLLAIPEIDVARRTGEGPDYTVSFTTVFKHLRRIHLRAVQEGVSNTPFRFRARRIIIPRLLTKSM